MKLFGWFVCALALAEAIVNETDDGWKNSLRKPPASNGFFTNGDKQILEIHEPDLDRCEEIRERLKQKCKKKLLHQKHFYEDNGYWPQDNF